MKGGFDLSDQWATLDENEEDHMIEAVVEELVERSRTDDRFRYCDYCTGIMRYRD